MAVTVIGMFQDQKNSENAIEELKDLGYNPKEMSVVMKEVKEARQMAQNTGVQVGQGAATGATAGGALGALAGLLIGIGAVTIPGLGPLLVAGPIATAFGLTGAAAATASGAVGGALAGGLLGALVGVGIPKEEAQKYEEQIRAGGVLLAVPSRDVRKDEVKNTLMRNHATDIRQLELPTDPEQIK